VELELWSAPGCPNCLGTGYLGRVGLFEALWPSNRLRQLIAEGAGEATLRRTATGLRTLWMDGREKALKGITSLEEVRHLNVEQGAANG
jgi:type IV pilus assembly protein PilB